MGEGRERTRRRLVDPERFEVNESDVGKVRLRERGLARRTRGKHKRERTCR